MYRTFTIGIMLTLLIVMLGCAPPKREKVVVVVESVRITSAIVQKINNGHPVGGAIAGGIIAGGTGAVIGYAIGNEESKIIVQNELLGCQFIVVEPKNNQRISFTIDKKWWRTKLAKCSLLRKGDKINLEKKVWRDFEKKLMAHENGIYWDDTLYGEIIN